MRRRMEVAKRPLKMVWWRYDLTFLTKLYG
jgi:hypothetical protein